MSKTRNMLTHSKTIKLYNWLKENPDVLEGRLYSQVALIASRELEFEVTEYHVSGINNDKEIDISWVPSRSRKKSNQKNTQHGDIKVLIRHQLKLMKAFHDEWGTNISVSREWIDLYQRTTGKPCPQWATKMGENG